MKRKSKKCNLLISQCFECVSHCGSSGEMKWKGIQIERVFSSTNHNANWCELLVGGRHIELAFIQICQN